MDAKQSSTLFVSMMSEALTAEVDEEKIFLPDRRTENMTLTNLFRKAARAHAAANIRFKTIYATSYNLANLDDACKILHISCHGRQRDQHAMLFFEHGSEPNSPLQRGSHLVLSERLGGPRYQKAQVPR
jgi:hypothetical protein